MVGPAPQVGHRLEQFGDAAGIVERAVVDEVRIRMGRILRADPEVIQVCGEHDILARERGIGFRAGLRIARVLCGGEVDAGSLVDEKWLLDLERAESRR